MRLSVALLLCLLTGALVGTGVWLFQEERQTRLPDGPVLVERVRDVARLQTLEVTLFKKVSLQPDPKTTGTLWRDVIAWAEYRLREPKGTALLFADATLWLDLSRMRTEHLRVSGGDVEVVLPPVKVQVALRPGDTEVLDSNLNSEQTAELFQLAHEAFQREVEQDAQLKARARESAERSLRALFQGLGFREVRFVEALAPVAGTG